MRTTTVATAIVMAITCVFSVGANVSNAQDSPAEGFVSLFNGKDLNGWIQKNGTAKYTIEDGGIICGTTEAGSPNSFLCTEKDFGNFELTFDVKVSDKLNSGVQIRSKTKTIPQSKSDDTKKKEKFGRVFGPQVEIEASGQNGAEAGYVYGEATGRGWLVPADRLKPHKHFKDGQWNTYRIVANGPRFQVWINGTEIIDLTDEAIFKTHPSGFIGLQVHSIGKAEGPYQVRWRKIMLKEIK